MLLRRLCSAFISRFVVTVEALFEHKKPPFYSLKSHFAKQFLRPSSPRPQVKAGADVYQGDGADTGLGQRLQRGGCALIVTPD
jgi:hypothetical protein